MKLFRHGPRGKEQPGIIDSQGVLRSLSPLLGEITPHVLSPAGLARLRSLELSLLPQIAYGTRIGIPWAGMSKCVCVGLNYTDHAQEAGLELPKEPMLFLKAPSAMTGPNDPIVLPKGAECGDWEVELGVVIGTRARYVDEADALSHVAGYCIVNDVSERSFQLQRGGSWDKGKGCDTFGPIGPWLVTSDEITDPRTLTLTLDVNDHRMQNGMTKNMVFSVARLVSYVSQFMTLQPGDLIATGTPAGVGGGHKPPIFLMPGDEMTLRISGLGEQRSKVYSWDAEMLDRIYGELTQ